MDNEGVCVRVFGAEFTEVISEPRLVVRCVITYISRLVCVLNWNGHLRSKKEERRVVLVVVAGGVCVVFILFPLTLTLSFIYTPSHSDTLFPFSSYKHASLTSSTCKTSTLPPTTHVPLTAPPATLPTTPLQKIAPAHPSKCTSNRPSRKSQSQNHRRPSSPSYMLCSSVQRTIT